MTCEAVRDLLTRPPTDASRAEVWAVSKHCLACPGCEAAMLATMHETDHDAEDALVEAVLADPELGRIRR
ncbi:MAG: hypothetical protein LC745_07750 [Planctomycetia bacterium]|nr:hypothetical protein [Planctomycetia bacterium]